MLILKINEEEKDKIQMGNLILLKEKLEEAEDLWKARLYQGSNDHRFTQGVSCLLKDLLEVLPTKLNK